MSPNLKYLPNLINDVNIKSLPQDELDSCLLFTCDAIVNKELICIEIVDDYAEINTMSKPGVDLYVENGGYRTFMSPYVILSLLRRHIS